MKSAEQIERSIRKLDIEAGAQRRERTLHDLVAAHTQQKAKPQASGRRSFGRTIMRRKPLRIAAAVTLAVLLVGAFSPGTGSVALSQTQRAVNTTLAWLKGMIVGNSIGEPPASSPGADEIGEQTANPNRREVTCAARLFKVSADEQGLWQALRDQGIELVRVSTDPEVYYAVLSQEQAQSFDASVTLKCLSAPRVTVLEGESGAIAIVDMTTQGPQGLAVGWLPTVSSDGRKIESTISFHDGRTGFEIPNASTESGGVVLILARRMHLDHDNGSPSTSGGSQDLLIRIQVDIQ
jgi:hypothetical protein